MSWSGTYVLAAVCGGLIWGAMSYAAPQPAAKPVAGWFNVFPDLSGYNRSFLSPEIGVGEKPVSYRQTARYEWGGNADRLLEVTLARDAAFKQKYAVENLRKEMPAPKEVRFGKRTGWHWQFEPRAGAGARPLAHRLVVPLGDDKALIVEAKGGGPWGPLF